jgi:hypothetical protein
MEVWVVQASPRLLYAQEGDPVPIVQEVVWAPKLVYTHTCARNLVPSGLDPRTVQPVASRYAICDIPAHNVVSESD